MNNRSVLSAHLETPRWWWTPGVAGVAVSAAIAAIVVVPLAGHAMPTERTRYEAPGTFHPAHPATPEAAGTEIGTVRPCFMVRPRWNVALDGPQPTCPLKRPTTGHGDTEARQPSRSRPNAYLGP
jgi:hypothetical protein